MLKGEIVTNIYRLCRNKNALRCSLKTILDTAGKYYTKEELNALYQDVIKGRIKPEVALMSLVEL
jgi:hypothetical protein